MDDPRPPKSVRKRTRQLATPGRLFRGLAPESSASHFRIADTHLSQQEFLVVDLDCGDVVNVGANGSRWIRCTLSELIVENCDLAHLALEDSGVLRSRLLGNRLTGATISKGIWSDVLIRDCVADLSSWRFTRFQRVAFENCRLVGTDWTSTQLKDVAFTNCDLTDAQFSQCRVERVHFSGCTLDRLKGLPSLSGASIDDTDVIAMAYQLAAALGLSVRHHPTPESIEVF